MAEKKARKELLQIIKDRDYKAAREEVDEAIDEYVPTEFGKTVAKTMADQVMPENDLDLALSILPMGKIGKILGKTASKVAKAGARMMSKAMSSDAPTKAEPQVKEVVYGDRSLTKPREDKPKQEIYTPDIFKPREPKPSQPIYTPDIFKPREAKPTVIKEVTVGGKPQASQQGSATAAPEVKSYRFPTTEAQPINRSPVPQKIKPIVVGETLRYDQHQPKSRIEADKIAREMEKAPDIAAAKRRGDVLDENLAKKIKLSEKAKQLLNTKE